MIVSLDELSGDELEYNTQKKVISCLHSITFQFTSARLRYIMLFLIFVQLSSSIVSPYRYNILPILNNNTLFHDSLSKSYIIINISLNYD